MPNVVPDVLETKCPFGTQPENKIHLNRFSLKGEKNYYYFFVVVFFRAES